MCVERESTLEQAVQESSRTTAGLERLLPLRECNGEGLDLAGRLDATEESIGSAGIEECARVPDAASRVEQADGRGVSGFRLEQTGHALHALQFSAMDDQEHDAWTLLAGTSEWFFPGLGNTHDPLLAQRGDQWKTRPWSGIDEKEGPAHGASIASLAMRMAPAPGWRPVQRRHARTP